MGIVIYYVVPYNYEALTYVYFNVHVSCLGSSGSGVLWGRSFFVGEVTAFGVLCCFALLFV